MVKVICFGTKSSTADVYRGFIDTLRDAVLSGKEVHGPNGFKLLRDPSEKLSDSERFVFVELTGWEKQHSIKLAIDVTDLYVVGYQTGNASFFFKEYNIKKAPYATLFPKTTPHSLPFGGSYGQLEQTGDLREKIDLGIEALGKAIELLSSAGADQNSKARPLIVVIQMVSESVRFKYIEQEVVHSITSPKNQQPSYRQFRPNPHVLSLENNWDNLSEQIQLAGKDGKFPRPVWLCPSTSYKKYKVTEISFNLYADIGVLKYNKPKK